MTQNQKIDLSAMEFYIPKTNSERISLFVSDVQELVAALKISRATLLEIEGAGKNGNGIRNYESAMAQTCLEYLDARFDFGDESGGEK